MGDMQHGRRGRLVDLAALDADQPILDVVHPTDTMGAGQGMQPLDELDRSQPDAVERDRDATLELDDDLDRVGCRAGIDRPLVGVRRRRDPRVLQDARLTGAAPQVHVDRVGRALGDRDLDPSGRGVVDRLRTGQAHPDPHRGDHLQTGIEGMDGDIEADLVVALAGAAVGDRVGPLARGNLHEELGDERSGQRGRQRVDALVQRVGLEVRPDEVRGEALSGVDHVGRRGAGTDRPTFHAFAQRAAPDIDGEGDHLGVELLPEPGHGDRRVEPARVGEDDFLHARASGTALGMGAGWAGA